jgi:menaquinone-dependent protoporphyrinogen oxidase
VKRTIGTGPSKKEGIIMKALVAVASRHNSTRELAEAIAGELRASGLDADLRAADAVLDISGYDAVVLGSGVYMGRWLPAARRFAELHGPALREVPVWLFSSGPIGAEDPKPPGDPAGIPELLEATCARGHIIFAGKLDKRSLGLAERLMVRVVHAPEGDFRDWDAVRNWARSIPSSLALVQSHRI